VLFSSLGVWTLVVTDGHFVLALASGFLNLGIDDVQCLNHVAFVLVMCHIFGGVGYGSCFFGVHDE
jgi:hypothetical protein